MKKYISLFVSFLLFLSFEATILAEKYTSQDEHMSINTSGFSETANYIDLICYKEKNELHIICTTKDGQKSEGSYNLASGICKLNGQILHVTTQKITSSNNMTFYGENYEAVYMASYEHKFDQIVNDISDAVTCIGTVIFAANALHLPLSALSKKITKWANSFGSLNWISGKVITGSFSYDLYKTKYPVMFPPANRPLTAFRYQNSAISFNIIGRYFYHSYNEIGDWWYAEKPF